MKKILLSLIAIIFAISFSYAQWTGGPTGPIYYNGGSVGIGTISPAQILHVQEAISGDLKALVQNTTANTASTATVETENDAGNVTNLGTSSSIYSAAAIIGANSGFLYSSTPSGLAMVLNDATSTLRITTGGLTERFRIDASGNVGIGTTSPLAKLQVGGGTTSGSSIAMVGGGNSGGAVNALSLVNNASAATGNEVDLTFHTAGTYSPVGMIGAIAESTQANSDLAFSVYNNSTFLTERMRILANGNLLVGKTSQTNSGYMVDVAGNARVNEVVVNATGADFVFKPSYKLNSLSNLKKYIDKNHHLPEIPSAREMHADGLSLGENQTKLLQKVEELTLYIIEKDKEIKALSAKLDAVLQAKTPAKAKSQSTKKKIQ